MEVKYFGTTMLLFSDGDKNILFDCHISRPGFLNCGFGKIRTDENKCDEIISEYIEKIDAIFISHSHYDHVMDMPYFANIFNSEVYGTNSTLNVARGGKVRDDKLHIFNDDIIEIGEFKIKVIPSKHSDVINVLGDEGKIIDYSLVQPTSRKKYFEGGSYDFYIENKGIKILIRPSYNYVKGKLDGINCDYLFQSIGGFIKKDELENFYAETISKVNPKVVIPIHWDNFFTPLSKDVKWIPKIFGDSKNSLKDLSTYCEKNGTKVMILLPLTSFNF